MMKVYFSNNKKQYENTNESVTQIVEDINSYMDSTDNIVLSHLNVDGVDVYENHYQILLDKLNTIDEIKLVVKTKQEVVVELQESLNEYLDRALPVMEKLANQFYQGESAETWDTFVDLTDGLQWINSAVMTLTHYSAEETASYYKSISDKLESILKELAEVLEIKDTVTIGDMIQYEIMEILTELKQNVQH
jgi:hypothetical protein